MSESHLRTALQEASANAPEEHADDTQKVISVAWTAYENGRDVTDVWREVSES